MGLNSSKVEQPVSGSLSPTWQMIDSTDSPTGHSFTTTLMPLAIPKKDSRGTNITQIFPMYIDRRPLTEILSEGLDQKRIKSIDLSSYKGGKGDLTTEQADVLRRVFECNPRLRYINLGELRLPREEEAAFMKLFAKRGGPFNCLTGDKMYQHIPKVGFIADNRRV